MAQQRNNFMKHQPRKQDRTFDVAIALEKIGARTRDKAINQCKKEKCNVAAKENCNSKLRQE